MKPEAEKDEVLKLFDKEERTYFQRLRDMFMGFSKPRDSLEYKEAMRELQRQWAPLLGVSIPLVICIVMCSITIGGNDVTKPPVDVTVIEPTTSEPLEPEEPPPPPENMELVETDLVDAFISDMPSPPIGEVTADVPTLNPPVQMTPATVKLAGVPSRGSGGGGIGGGVRLEGDMVGMFVDLSRDAKGNSRLNGKNGFGSRDALLHSDVRFMIEKNFGKEAFAPYNVVPQRVYLSHLALPYVSSLVGPKTYKVEKQVKDGSPWVAVYRGKLQPESNGVYRLAGFYDDVLVVRVNGKLVLEFAWTSRNNGANKPTSINSGWVQTDATVAGKHKMRGFQNTPLTYSDWFELRANESVPIEILIGDNGGDGKGAGLTGGILLVEKRGETYAKADDGLPLLPLFTTTRLTFTERQRLEGIADRANKATSKHYAFDMKNVPLMNTCGKKAPSLTQGDIAIDTGDL